MERGTGAWRVACGPWRAACGPWRLMHSAKRLARSAQAGSKKAAKKRRVLSCLKHPPNQKGWNMKTTKYFVVYSKNPSCFKKIFS